MSGLINDALLLCRSVLDCLTPNEDWAIINIAKTSNRTFTFPSIPEIPTSFGYTYDNVPKLLIENGVIEETLPNRWYVSLINRDEKYQLSSWDNITSMLYKNKYINNDKKAYYYYSYSHSTENRYGPKISGQHAVLINKQKLLFFTNWYSNQWPKFNNTTGTFEYLGYQIKFEGDLIIKTVNLLINNINSIVNKEVLYDVRGTGDFQIMKKRGKVTSANDATKKIYESIKKKIKDHEQLKKYLVIASWEGYGLFISYPKPDANPKNGKKNSQIDT